MGDVYPQSGAGVRPAAGGSTLYATPEEGGLGLLKCPPVPRSEPVRIPQEDHCLRKIPPTARPAALPLKGVPQAVGVHSDRYAQRERFSTPPHGHPRIDQDDVARLAEAVVSAAHAIVDGQPVDPTSEAHRNALVRPQRIREPEPSRINIGY